MGYLALTDLAKPEIGRKTILGFYGEGVDDAMLPCPYCGSDNLHHEVVTVYSRSEDSDRTVETRVDGRVTECGTVPSKISQNPSLRRDGLAIRFFCEQCPSRPELAIWQHKGSSYMAWRRPREVRA